MLATRPTFTPPRLETKYRQLMLVLRSQCKEVRFVNLFVGVLDVMNNSLTTFFDMMKDFGFVENAIYPVDRSPRFSAAEIKDWMKPELFTFQDFHYRLCTCNAIRARQV